MGDKDLEAGGHGEQEGYKVTAYKAKDLPQNYHNLIFSKWKRSLRYGNDYFKLIDQDHYYTSYQRYIDTLLSRPNCMVRIAALSDDADVVLGWSVMEPNILHYVHVGADYRNQGIGKALVPGELLVFTHLTKQAMNIWHRKYPQAKFRPF